MNKEQKLANNMFFKGENKPKASPGSKRAPEGDQPDILVPRPPVIAEEKKTAPANEELVDSLVIAPKKVGNACGFYLSPEAQDNLARLAKEKGCSKSKALDALLRSLYE